MYFDDRKNSFNLVPCDIHMNAHKAANLNSIYH